MRHPHLPAQRVRQQGNRPRHNVRQHPRALASAHHQNRHWVIAGWNIPRARPIQHRPAHRVADILPNHTLRQSRGPCATCHRIHMPRKHPVHPPQNAVLFMDGPRQSQYPSRHQRRNGWIATKSHHHRRPVAQHPHRRRNHPAHNRKRHRQFRRQTTARKRRRRHLLHLHHMRKPARIARAAHIGR